jgi:hypothetical protein
MTCCAIAGLASADARIAAAARIPDYVMGDSIEGAPGQAFASTIVPMRPFRRESNRRDAEDSKREAFRFRLCDLRTDVKFRLLII